MSTLKELELQQVAPRLLEVLRREGVANLSRFQIATLEAGIARKKNLILATHDYGEGYEIAEIAALNRVAKDYRAKAIFLCPNPHQAEVRFHSVGPRCARLGISAEEIIRRRDATRITDLRARVIVATFSSFDIASRLNPSILDDVKCVVVERLDLIGHPSVGARLETALVTLLGLESVQVIGVGPPLENSDELAEWLDSKVVPDQKEDLKRIFSVKTFDDSDVSLADLAGFVHSKKGQTLVLCVNKARSQELAQKLAGIDDDDDSGLVNLRLSPEHREELKQLSEDVMKQYPHCHLTQDLAMNLAHGIAFVHEGVASAQRRKINEAWEKGILPIITIPIRFALPAGFNATMAFLEGVFMQNITSDQTETESLTLLNEWQMNDLIGSVGRRRRDAEAFGIVVVENDSEKARVLARYFSTDKEGNLVLRPGEVDSSMDEIENLQDLVLLQLCGKEDDEDPFSVIERTFWGSSKRITDVTKTVVDSSDESIDRLLAQRSTKATYDRALAIPDDAVKIVSVRPDKIEGLVRSSSRELWHYTSLRSREGVSCSCESYKYQGIRRHRLCKHLLKFSLYSMKDKGSKPYAEGVIRQALRGLEVFKELEEDRLVIRKGGRAECTELGNSVALLGVPVRDARRVLNALTKEKSDLGRLLRGIIHAKSSLPKDVVTQVLKSLPAEKTEEVFCAEHMPGIVENCLEEIEYINSILLRLLEKKHPLRKESEALNESLMTLFESMR